MTQLVLRYPLDPTGTSTNNLVQSEPHTLVRRLVRAIAPTYGAFFTESLQVFDAATNQPLIKDQQYYAAELYDVPTARFGKEVCAIIIVTDPAVSDNVTLNYQAVGGDFSTSTQAIVQMFETLRLDNRPTDWNNIIDRPSEFAPSHHLHDIGDVYGFEYLTHAIERVRAAIEFGSELSDDKFFNYTDTQVGAFRDALNALAAQVGLLASQLNGASATSTNKTGDTFSGLMAFNGGLRLNSFLEETVTALTANTSTTVLDLRLSTVFQVTVAANTAIAFNFQNMPAIPAGKAVGFTLITVNDSTPGRATSFVSPIKWAGGQIPSRTTTPGARDEWYFVTYDQGATYIGSLANQDVK